MREDSLRLRSRALAELSTRLADEPDRAIPYARALVELTPDDEQARASFIRLLHAAGRDSEAQHHQVEGLRVAKDLGLAPPVVLQGGRRVTASDAKKQAPPAATGGLNQEIRFCTSSDGVRLAYAKVGKGPPLVKAANWLNHLEYDWESPIWRPMFQELADGAL